MTTTIVERKVGMGVQAMAKIPGRLFGDVLVTATELNRKVGATLDKALSTPVTITRNDQHFALLRREEVALMFAVSEQSSKFAEVMQAIKRARSGANLAKDREYAWLSVFDDDELSEMMGELVDAFGDMMHGGGGADAVGTVIHEWRESAIAVGNDALAQAMGSEDDPTPLTPPMPDGAPDKA